MCIRIKSSRQSHGFTLIEMAVVLVIVMTILTLGLGALNSIMTSSASAETKVRQTHIKDALIAYFGANKRFPCPDIPNNTNGTSDSSGVTGNEDKPAATGTCAGTFGVIPFATLGLSRDVAEDGWGGLISYQVYTRQFPVCPGAGVDWTNSNCFGAGKAGGIQIADGTVSSPTIIATGVVAVLVSHGQNGLGAWVRQGTRNAVPRTCEEGQNSLLPLSGCALTTNQFFKGERSGNDDVVAYLTADDVIQTLAKQGTLLSATAQVSDDFAKMRDDKINTKMTAGSCATSVGIASSIDPWGNGYVVIEAATPNLLPICICSTGGTGVLPTGSSCTPVRPTTCVQIDVGDVNPLRVRLGNPPC